MALVRDANRLGLWADPALAGKAGTYAVIVGVSSYAHLDGGTGPVAAETYGLGQLAVSARTAYSLFEWLGSQYRYEASPLAACWLLLSPTHVETALWPKLKDAEPATFQNCQTVLLDWYRTMHSLQVADAERSRALFFFSGHGMELMADHQVLLPSDYLGGAANPNQALSTYNLVRGVRTLPLTEAMFFVDACRSRPDGLAGFKLRGADVLLENDEPPRRGQSVPIVYASAAGTEAWQPDDPADGESYFGRALLDGLGVAAPGMAECDQRLCRLPLLSLAGFLGKRVRELLARTDIPSLVQLSGNSGNPCVTELPLPSAGTPPPPPLGTGGAFRTARRRGRVADATARIGPVSPRGLRGHEASWSDLHDAFGHERLTDFWRSARMLRIPSNEEDPAHTIHHIEHQGTDRLTVELSFERRGSHWLEFPSGDHRFAAVLPDDERTLERPRYVVEIVRERDAVVSRMNARLAPHNPGLLGLAARAWDSYENLQVDSATLMANEVAARDRSLEEPESQLAPLVAALLLLRFNDVPVSLLHHFGVHERIPDFPVLGAEWLRREPAAARRPDAARLTLSAARLGLPWTGDALGYLAHQLDAMVRTTRGADERRRVVPDEAERRDAEHLLERVNLALSVFRPGGLFVSFAGPPEIVNPKLLALG
jgi:hypothetical protein